MVDADRTWRQSSHLNNFMWSSNVMKNKYDEQKREIQGHTNGIDLQEI